jgi:hypothetical protein
LFHLTSVAWDVRHGSAGDVTHRRSGSVEQEYMGRLSVWVFRPRIAEVSLNEDNRAMTAGSPASRGMPMTLAQLLKVATPRGVRKRPSYFPVEEPLLGVGTRRRLPG